MVRANMECKYIEIPSVEAKYRRLRKLGLELGIPICEQFVEAKVTMPDGEVTHWHKQRSHSLTRNAYNLVLMFTAKILGADSTFGAGKLNVKGTDAAIIYSPSYALWAGGSSYTVETANAGYRSAAAGDDFGILVGTGSTAESFENFGLQTIVVNGNGTGQLAYTASEAPTKTYTALSLTWDIALIRYFNNNSGGTIVVAECALAAYEPCNWLYYVCYSRDVLGSAVNVLNTGQLKVTYTWSLVYPA